MKTYKASLNITAKIITGVVLLAAIYGIGTAIIYNAWDSVQALLGVLLTILIIPAYLHSVKGYQITDEKLIIKRPLSMLDKQIPLSEIKRIQLLTSNDFKWTVRTFGDGGLFGYYGLFSNSRLGSFRMYATNNKNRILLILGEAEIEIVLSPDDPTMAADLKKLIGKPA